MSGGHFDYHQSSLNDLADQIRELINNNADTSENEWGFPRGWGYSPETISKLEEAEEALRRASKMLHRVDWLVSGDDGEETFHKRWDKDLSGLTPNDRGWPTCGTFPAHTC
jgi:hypothetical protein